jgi:hypothetical protein
MFRFWLKLIQNSIKNTEARGRNLLVTVFGDNHYHATFNLTTLLGFIVHN